MAIKINFDSQYQPIPPTFVLCLKNGDRLGLINNISKLRIRDSFNDVPEISFTVSKYDNDETCVLWDEIKNFRLVWCKEFNTIFELTVTFEDSESVIKNIQLHRLAESELSQINVYNLQCNTEEDIMRDDYDAEHPTCIYDAVNTNRSLLHRLLENAPHYQIESVDASIAGLVRTFSFDKEDIKSCLDEICEEISAVVVYNSSYDSDDNIVRSISLKDLQANCLESNCNYRGEFEDVCPKCGSTNIKEGYGNDTGIFITKDKLADNITFETDTDSVKNCFRLIAGDDLMTETIVNCNPNGSRYLWYFSDKMKQDMPEELVAKINEYDEDYTEYNNEHEYSINPTAVSDYNDLVTKYISLNPDLEGISNTITGYPNLVKAYYNSIDFALYLKSWMLPPFTPEETSASDEWDKLSAVISPIAVTNLSYISATTVDSAIVNYARLIVNKNYRVKVVSSSYSNNTWTGKLNITNYSDDTDTFTNSDDFSVTINDDYETYINYKVKDAINDYIESEDNYDIGAIFALPIADFKDELEKYSLDHLTIFRDCCQSVINVLAELGGGDSSISADVYNDTYTAYREKLTAIDVEMVVRTDEITTIAGKYWEVDTSIMTEPELKELNSKIEELKDSGSALYGVQRILYDYILETQAALNFEDYLGISLWEVFSSFRREDVYQNNNYISDGLDTKQLFDNALEFIERAKQEIYKSANHQHKISASLKNLLVMEEFKNLVNSFEKGNWIRIQVENEIYKLRLLDYELDYDNLDDLNVEFSDVIQVFDGISDVESVLKQASSMASSYGNVAHQASNGNDSKIYMDKWFSDGLDLTKMKIIGNAKNQNQIIDNKGILCRAWLDEVDQYDPIQMKIINSTIAVTDDNWETVKTAMGRFVYKDPADSYKIKYGYGINGETLVGNLILGNQLGIYNGSGSLSFNEEGLVVTGNHNQVSIKPNTATNPNSSVFSIKTVNSGTVGSSIFDLDTNGNLELSGKITASAGSSFGAWTVGANAIYHNNATFESANGMYFGNSGLSLSDKFSVTSAGKLKAADAKIVGTISSIGVSNVTQITTIENGSISQGYHFTSDDSSIFVGGLDVAEIGQFEYYELLYYIKEYENHKGVGIAQKYGNEYYAISLFTLGSINFNYATYAPSFNVTSTENVKTNIKEESSVLSYFKESKIYNYDLIYEPIKSVYESEDLKRQNNVVDNNKNDESQTNTKSFLQPDGKNGVNKSEETQKINISESKKKKIGFVIGRETPDELISDDGEHIDLYSMCSVTWKAVQELLTKIESLEAQIKELKGE